jgi:hypothetical protein
MPTFGSIKNNTLSHTEVLVTDTGTGQVEATFDSLEVKTDGGVGTYTFPSVLGNTGDILKLTTTGSNGTLDFAVPDSNVLFGPGVKQLGSTDDRTEIISGPLGDQQIMIDSSGQNITIGSSLNVNSIYLNGGIEYQYNEISTTVGPYPNPSTAPTYNISDNDYMVNIVDSAYLSVQLPKIDQIGLNRSGKMFIIARGFSGGSDLLIKPSPGDDIDGETISVSLPANNVRIQLIANGNTKWLIL